MNTLWRLTFNDINRIGKLWVIEKDFDYSLNTFFCVFVV